MPNTFPIRPRIPYLRIFECFADQFLTQKVAIVLKYKILGFSGFQTRVLTPLSQVATLNIEKETWRNKIRKLGIDNEIWPAPIVAYLEHWSSDTLPALFRYEPWHMCPLNQGRVMGTSDPAQTNGGVSTSTFSFSIPQKKKSWIKKPHGICKKPSRSSPGRCSQTGDSAGDDQNSTWKTIDDKFGIYTLLGVCTHTHHLCIYIWKIIPIVL